MPHSPGVNVRGSQGGDDLVDGLHHHAAVGLGLVLEVALDLPDNVGAADLLPEGNGGLDDLLVVPAVERHLALPKVPEELLEDLGADVGGLHALGLHALHDHLEHDLLHLLVLGLELAQQDDHHLRRRRTRARSGRAGRRKQEPLDQRQPDGPLSPREHRTPR